MKTYVDVLLEYEYHPESKYADAHGKVCGKQTVGLPQRRHVRIDQIEYIGKESNSLEGVEAGLHHSQENVYTEYIDPASRRMGDEDFAGAQEVAIAIFGRSDGAVSHRNQGQFGRAQQAVSGKSKNARGNCAQIRTNLKQMRLKP